MYTATQKNSDITVNVVGNDLRLISNYLLKFLSKFNLEDILWGVVVYKQCTGNSKSAKSVNFYAEIDAKLFECSEVTS